MSSAASAARATRFAALRNLRPPSWKVQRVISVSFVVCEGPRSGSSRSDHTGNPGVASVTEDPPSIRCEHAACRLARRQADSAHLTCGRTHSGESGRQSVYNTGQIHARARMRRASPGSSRQMLDRSGHRAVRNSQSTASFSRRFCVYSVYRAEHRNG